LVLRLHYWKEPFCPLRKNPTAFVSFSNEVPGNDFACSRQGAKVSSADRSADFHPSPIEKVRHVRGPDPGKWHKLPRFKMIGSRATKFKSAA